MNDIIKATAQATANVHEPRWGRGVLVGKILGQDGAPIRGLQVYLADSEGSEQQTSTNITGNYQFMNLTPGKYTLVAGDHNARITVRKECSPVKPMRADLNRVRKVLNLRTASMWEVADTLDLPSQLVSEIGLQLNRLSNERDVAKCCQADSKAIERWGRSVVFEWSKPPSAKQLGQQHNVGTKVDKATKKKTSNKSKPGTKG